MISEFDATNAGTAEMGINAALMLGLLGESDDGAAVIELLLQIHAEATNIKLEVRTASSVHVAAEPVALLPQLNAVADLGGILGRRHATGAAADNKQLSGMCSLFELVLTLGRSSGIYRAGGAANKWVAVVETLKAGAAEVYVVHSAVLDLAGPVGVGKRLLAEGYHIRESGLDDSLRLNGIIELALNEERHCDAFLAQALCDVELCPLLLVCAWNGKIPAFIAAIVDMHIGKVHILQTAGNLYALVLKGASTLNLVDRRIFYRNGEVGANCTANGLCALIKEAHTVIKRLSLIHI